MSRGLTLPSLNCWSSTWVAGAGVPVGMMDGRECEIARRMDGWMDGWTDTAKQKSSNSREREEVVPLFRRVFDAKGPEIDKGTKVTNVFLGDENTAEHRRAQVTPHSTYPPSLVRPVVHVRREACQLGCLEVPKKNFFHKFIVHGHDDTRRHSANIHDDTRRIYTTTLGEYARRHVSTNIANR